MATGLRWTERQLQDLQDRLAKTFPRAEAPKKNKYGNTKVVDSLGRKFDSKREQRRYLELQQLIEAGQINSLETQVRYELVPKQQKPGGGAERAVHYVADFVYFTKGGEKVVEDTKGFRTPEYVIKRKLMLSVHNIQIQEV